MKRQPTELESQASGRTARERLEPIASAMETAHGLAADIHRYGEDLEHRYVEARDAWLKAMHAANSGRSADLASLAITQEAYEAVATEREHFIASGRVAIPIESDPGRHDVEVAVGQELRWREVLEQKPATGLIGRIKRRLGGR